jgi:opacity protein-like surface antigen
MQVRSGRVSLTNGSNTVFGVYDLLLVGVSGSFVAGESLGFSPTGAAGVVTSWDPGAGRLSCRITSTAQPAAEDAVSQTPTLGEGTVSDVAFAPALSTSGIAPGAVFTRRRSGVTYEVQSVEGAGRLTLAGPYAGATEAEAEYSITTSFTPNAGIPYVEDGDVDVGAITRRAALRLDALLQDVLGIGLGGTFSGNARKSVRVRADENGLELFSAADRNAPSEQFTGNLAVGLQLAVIGLITPYGGIYAEPVRVVGAPTQPAFENGWTNHDDAAALRYAAGFWKQADGMTHLRGCVTKANLPDGETIFTLPAGYRPARLMVFAASEGAGNLILVGVAADGAVRKISGPTTAGAVLLDGISLRAET